MKKNLIAFLLAVVLVAESIGMMPVFAAETTIAAGEAEDTASTEKTSKGASIAEEAIVAQPDDSALFEGKNTAAEVGENSPTEEAATEAGENASTGQATDEAGESGPSEALERDGEEQDSDDEMAGDSAATGATSAAGAEEASSTSETVETDAEAATSNEPKDSSPDDGIEMPLVPFSPNDIELPDEPVDPVNSDIVASGSCGNNAKWTLTATADSGTGTTGNLTLTISGSGAMKHYNYNEEYDDDFEPVVNTNIPWYNATVNAVVSNSAGASAAVANVGNGDADQAVANIGNGDADQAAGNGTTTAAALTISYAPRITTLIVEDGITGIDSFCGLSNLTSVTIADSVASIGYRTFYKCSSLARIELPDSVTSIGNNAFEECGSLTSIGLPGGIKSISAYAFYECESLKSIEIPSSVTSINAYAFYDCTSLKAATIPESVTNIGSHAFYKCSSLTDVEIPNGVTTIAYDAFGSCTSLTAIALPGSVTSIGKYAFSGCTSLTSVEIPDSVTSINAYAFSGCSSLASIAIPASVTDIYSYAFGMKKTATAVRFLGSPDQWDYATRNRTVYYKSIVFGTFSVDADFALPKAAYNFTGKAVKPAVTASYKGKPLVEGRDYRVEYFDNVALGTATVHVNGIGAYSGTAYLRFKIQLAPTSKVTCTNVASGMKVSWTKVAGATRYKVYRDGELIFTTSALVVTDKAVKYNNGSKFTYKVVAVEKNTGDSPVGRTATYYRLMPVGIKSVTNPAAGKMTVTYDWVGGSSGTAAGSGVSGYVVRFGLKSDMSDAKVITVQSVGIMSRTFSGLIKGKTYYVQVRTYKIDNGVRYYSGYCTTKTVKIVQ